MRISKSLTGMIMLLAFFMAVMLAADAQAYTVKQQWARFSATCGETITEGQMIALKDADGYAYKADADAATLRPAVGIAGKGCVSGGKTEVVVYGIVSGWTSLSEGAAGYLSETAGAITQSSQTWSQQVGYAINTTTYLINCQNYTDTSALTALGVLSGGSPIVLEGATADDYETTFAVTDPTADRTVTIPNASGNFALASGANTSGVILWGDCDSTSFDTGNEVCAAAGLTCLNSFAITDSSGAWSAVVACNVNSCGAGATLAAFCY